MQASAAEAHVFLSLALLTSDAALLDQAAVELLAWPRRSRRCDALLLAMGVRERHRLAGVPYALIEAWKGVLDHPGLAARFDDPIAFAVAHRVRERDCRKYRAAQATGV